jgi:cysteine desulfurase / selenocysteine lyase
MAYGYPMQNKRDAVDWKAVRGDFPVLDQEVNGHPLIYFDNAATSQKPRQVIAALTQFYERDNSNVHRGLHTLSNRATEAFEAARRRMAEYLGAGEEEIVFTRGTTESINLVARAWGDANVGAGDAILLTAMEHHSNLVPWQMLAQRTGAELRFVPLDGGGRLDLEGLDRLLEGAKVFAFTHISNSLGTINPAAELCAQARKAGVTTLVDCAQSAGHRPLNFAEIGCDFLVFSGHKMCGPTGIGVLAGRREILNAMPPFHGGGEMIERARYEESSYKETPFRFEAGTPSIADAVALGAAAGYVDAIGREAIWEHDATLIAAALEELKAVPGLRVLGPPGARAPLASFVVDGVHAHDIVMVADEFGLALRGGHHCTQPLLTQMGVPSSARASLYFYNTIGEVSRMGEILRKVVAICGA